MHSLSHRIEEKITTATGTMDLTTKLKIDSMFTDGSYVSWIGSQPFLFVDLYAITPVTNRLWSKTYLDFVKLAIPKNVKFCVDDQSFDDLFLKI